MFLVRIVSISDFLLPHFYYGIRFILFKARILLLLIQWGMRAKNKLNRRKLTNGEKVCGNSAKSPKKEKLCTNIRFHSWLVQCVTRCDSIVIMWNFIIFVFVIVVCHAAAKVFDLSHDVNNDTLYWPTGDPFQLFINKRGLDRNIKVFNLGLHKICFMIGRYI